MSYGEKYQIVFKNLQGDTCKVRFYIDGYTGSIIQLKGTEKAFTLREYNTEEDIFKPVRPQIAEINFLSDNATLDDFIGNNDTYCYIGFEYLSPSEFYWEGYLLQDEFQEIWQDNLHIISLRATEGIGLLKTVQMDDGSGNELRGNYKILDLIQYATSGTVPTWTNYTVVNNLYQKDMDITDPEPSMYYAYLDGNTFSIGDGEYDDKYTVLEKINRAFNQTLFQYRGYWRIHRIEESFAPINVKMLSKTFNAFSFPNQWFQQFEDYLIDVGVNEEIYPIAPDMIRFIERPTKIDKINYYYDIPTEIIPNQNFIRGTLITDGGTYKTYTVDDWTAEKGYRETPTSNTTDAYRKDIIDIYGNITDSYLYLEHDETTTPVNANWWQSQDVKVSKGDILTISFSWKWAETNTLVAPIPTFNVAQVLFKASATPQIRAGLQNDGVWKIYSGDWDSETYANQAYLTIKPDDTSLDENGWATITVTSKSILRDGIIRVLLTNTYGKVFDNVWKQLNVTIQGSLNGLTTSNIDGQYESYTKSADIKQNYEQEIFLGDSPNYNFKGAIYNSNDELVTPLWYRARYQNEEFGFKNQNLISHWQRNKFYRNKIDVTFFGLKQDDKPIGLMNRIRFVNDDSDKLYLIANLKEIDFQNATWTATLAQIFDSNNPNGYDLYSATINNATYTTTDPLNVTLNHNEWFDVVDNTKITYQGVYNNQTIGIIQVNINGTVNITTTTPVTGQFFLKKNGSTIATGNINITTNPQTISFSFSSSSQTVDTGDYYQISFGSEITSFTENNSTIALGPFLWPIEQSFDTYKKDYIYK